MHSWVLDISAVIDTITFVSRFCYSLFVGKKNAIPLTRGQDYMYKVHLVFNSFETRILCFLPEVVEIPVSEVKLGSGKCAFNIIWSR